MQHIKYGFDYLTINQTFFLNPAFTQTNKQKSKGTCQGRRGTDTFSTNREVHKQKTRQTHTHHLHKNLIAITANNSLEIQLRSGNQIHTHSSSSCYQACNYIALTGAWRLVKI